MSSIDFDGHSSSGTVGTTVPKNNGVFRTKSASESLWTNQNPAVADMDTAVSGSRGHTNGLDTFSFEETKGKESIDNELSPNKHRYYDTIQLLIHSLTHSLT